MRRTRHVTLPVRSWQYIGLLIVSLACLTLGLVSRDREGRHGTLAGPELQHIAPHKVDACPNIAPYSLVSTPGITTIDTKNENEFKKRQPTETSLQTFSSERLLKTRSNTPENRIQCDNFLDNRSRTRTTRFKFIFPENHRRIFVRLNKGSRNHKDNRLERIQFRSQNRDQVRERRLQNEPERTINQTPSQRREDQRRQSNQDARLNLRRHYRTSFRIQENSRNTLNAMKSSQSFNRLSFPDRQRSYIRSEIRQILMRRINPQIRVSRSKPVGRNQEIRQVGISERFNLNIGNFHRNYQNLMSSTRNTRHENSRARESERDVFNGMKRTQSLDHVSFPDRQTRDIHFERREIFLRRTSPQVTVSHSETYGRDHEIRQARFPEKSNLNSGDFRRHSRDLMSFNRNVRLESSQARESQRKSVSRENFLLQRQSQNDKVNNLNKRMINWRIDLSRYVRLNSDFKTRDLTVKHKGISFERQQMEFRLNERSSLMMDKRVDVKRSRYDDVVRNNILNRVDTIQSRRENRVSVKPEIAQKYLSYEMSNVLSYEVLRQALVIALCVAYGTSFYNDKNSVIKRFAFQVNRLVSA